MLVNVSGVKKGFGVDEILCGATFRMEGHEKIALVGRNGTGKTTLLRILTGQIEPDFGSVQFARGVKIGYLRQETPVDGGRTVLEEAQQAVQHRLDMQVRLEELERTLEEGPSDDDLEEYARLHEHFMDAEGYSTERDLRAVLLRMGFGPDEYDKPTSKLSGGEKTRLAIARLLLEEPDLLILDEPTNHLDLQATEWLESWIRGYHGAVLLVSHDREFLSQTAERFLEMREGQLFGYPGPFDKYQKLRAEEFARQAEVAKRQDQEIARLDEYVRRFMNSQRTAQARGRQKLMNRLIENRVEAPKNEKGMKAGFTSTKRSGDLVLEAQKLKLGFGEEILIDSLDWTVRYGERWGVIGENGSGKSTLVKACLGQLEPLGGKVKLGSNVVTGYFSQDTSELDADASPIDMLVWDCDMLPAEARNLLGRFLITGDDVYRPIKTLSGGEKNKLSLARLTILNPNLLVLDEPTNHLDMASREALAEVLGDYKGTLVLVSHDRWLLSNVTDQTLDIKRTGPVTYPGSYAQYRSRGLAAPSQPSKSKTPTISAVESEKPSLSPREVGKEIERIGRVVADTESLAASQEFEIHRLEGILANLPPDADVFALTRQHQQFVEALEGTMAVWEEQSKRLHELQSTRQ